jgi:putative intracellular protease/amidase
MMNHRRLGHKLRCFGLAALFLVGCSSTPVETPAASTSLPIVPPAPTATLALAVQPTPTVTVKRALLIIFDQFEELEYGEPRAVLEKQGINISVASSGTRSVAGSLGKKVQPDVALSEVYTADYDAVVFIGGYSYDESNVEAIRIAQEAVAQNKIVAAICIAPITLAKAGVLKDKRATSSMSFATLKAAGAVYTSESVVRDGNLITGNGPAASRKFGEAIAAALTATHASIVSPTPADSFSEQERATLNSLEKVADFPLYTMHYYGSTAATSAGTPLAQATLPRTWACLLFAALGGADKFYGRNFDWVDSPALLLFNHPTNGYASVSMVDLAYLEFGDKVDQLTELPLVERRALLEAPALPFDGMNERGLVVGMAAVPDGNVPPDPNKETIDSLQAIRKMLDQAATVDEAVAIMQRYNIEWGNGPALHYLIADRSGRAALVEFYQGELRVIPTDKPWHLATNFLRSAVAGNATGQCPRYDKIDQRLSTTEGKLTAQAAMSLLGDVSQGNTQWSIVYGLSTGAVTVTLGRQYDQIYTFYLDRND